MVSQLGREFLDPPLQTGKIEKCFWNRGHQTEELSERSPGTASHQWKLSKTPILTKLHVQREDSNFNLNSTKFCACLSWHISQGCNFVRACSCSFLGPWLSILQECVFLTGLQMTTLIQETYFSQSLYLRKPELIFITHYKQKNLRYLTFYSQIKPGVFKCKLQLNIYYSAVLFVQILPVFRNNQYQQKATSAWGRWAPAVPPPRLWRRADTERREITPGPRSRAQERPPPPPSSRTRGPGHAQRHPTPRTHIPSTPPSSPGRSLADGQETTTSRALTALRRAQATRACRSTRSAGG